MCLIHLRKSQTEETFIVLILPPGADEPKLAEKSVSLGTTVFDKFYT